MMQFIEDFYGLFFPRICAGCGKSLFRNEEYLCALCLYELPKTNFHLAEDNALMRVFWGRVFLQRAASYYYFTKGGLVQRMIHQLKYKENQEIGVYLGQVYGRILKESGFCADFDYLIPVPLHKKRQRKRGYNQSEVFANGLAESTGVPVCTRLLLRVTASSTQTRKSKFMRWKNVEHLFALRNEQDYAGKHLVLIDDVITTGATLEACAHALENVKDVRISVISIACVA